MKKTVLMIQQRSWGVLAIPKRLLSLSIFLAVSMSLLSTPSSALAMDVTGKVTDENGAIPGVNVLVKGTNTGTTTDSDGNYSINTPDQNVVLVFSYIGYESQEIPLNGQTVLNVQLAVDITQLNEIVVVGYGTQKRSSLTGAVSSVSAKEVSALPVASVESAIQGRAPGVIVTNNGSPGSSPIVRIRGIGSITGSSDPLYVIDGFPQAGNLSNFDTKDIESVEVLKDAAATAIYGSRAANGVILITTKSGSKDSKVHVDVDSYYGVQTAWKQLDLLKRNDYVAYGTALLTNAGNALPSRFSTLNTPIYAGSNQTYAQTDTDWQGAMFRTAPIAQTQVAISSSSEKSKLYTSFSKFHQEGIMLGTAYDRYSARINYENKINKRITFGQNLNISYGSTQNEPSNGGRTQIQHIVHSVPYIPIHDPTVDGGFRAPSGSDGSDPENPVRIATMDQNHTGTLNLLGKVYVEVGIIDGLKYKFSYGVNYSVGRYTQDLPIYFDGFAGRITHNLQDNRNNNYSPYYSNQLTYDKKFGDHNLNIVAVAERQDSKYTGLSVGGQQATNAISQLGGSTNQNISNGQLSQTVLLSYLGRINYDFKGKYLLSASIRRDGFSGFAPGNKWGAFPGASVGWKVSEEGFLKGISLINDLKIRASYGSLGANTVGAYGYQSFIGTQSTYPFNNTNQQGSYFSQLPNAALTWEKTNMSNIGFDLGMMENRITLSAEYFVKKVDGILLDRNPPPTLGYSQPTKQNIGGMQNSGLEFTLGYAKATGDFTYNVSGNLSTINNKVTKLYSDNIFYAGANNDFGGGQITRTAVGSSIQEFYGYFTDGIFQSQAEINAANGKDGNAATLYQPNAAPGDIRFKDLNGDGVIDAKDQTSLGSFLPKFYYGLNFSANYKSFDLTLFFQGSQGNKIYNGVKVLTEGMLRLFNADQSVKDAWTPTNTNTDIPRAVNGDPNQNSRTSNRFVEDGSYLRLKNINLGYTIPAATLQKISKGSVNKLRVYISSQNLLTFTKYTGYDPEIGNRNGTGSLTQGIDYGQFPAARTIMGGIQIGF